MAARRAGRADPHSLAPGHTVAADLRLPAFRDHQALCEKIRQQFATDSAAFIQMGDYTNLLNRTAYVNGAFPYRIFKEAYECPSPETPLQMASGSGQICPYDMLYAAGLFPKYTGDVKGQQPASLDDTKKWDIVYDAAARPEFASNPTSKTDKGVLDLITQDQGVKIMIE